MINTHEHMRVIHKVHKVRSKFGTYEVRLTQVKGLRLRKMAMVLKKK